MMAGEDRKEPLLTSIGGPGHRGSQEGISALRTEKVLYVIRALAKCWIIQTDELLLDDGRLARVALGGEHLKSFST
jgi:hypothetical protein